MPDIATAVTCVGEFRAPQAPSILYLHSQRKLLFAHNKNLFSQKEGKQQMLVSRIYLKDMISKTSS